MLQEFLSELRQMIPAERVYTDELRRLGWGTDASFYRQIPQVVVRSDGEEEISKIVQLCKNIAFWPKLYGFGAHCGGKTLGEVFSFGQS